MFPGGVVCQNNIMPERKRHSENVCLHVQGHSHTAQRYQRCHDHVHSFGRKEDEGRYLSVQHNRFRSDLASRQAQQAKVAEIEWKSCCACCRGILLPSYPAHGNNGNSCSWAWLSQSLYRIFATCFRHESKKATRDQTHPCMLRGAALIVLRGKLKWPWG